MADISEKVLHELETKQLAPHSRLRFLLKRALLWSVYTLSILLGGLATSATIYFMSDREWGLLPRLRMTFLDTVLTVLPFFWLALLAALFVAAYFDFKHTDRGYRIRPVYIIASNLLLSVLLGFTFHFGGISQTVDNYLDLRMPSFPSSLAQKRAIWSRPDVGLLSGEIIQVQMGTDLVLMDWNGDTWTVINDNAFWPPMIGNATGTPIKIIGRMLDEDSFYAEEIRPWEAPVHRRPRLNPMMRPMPSPPPIP